MRNLNIGGFKNTLKIKINMNAQLNIKLTTVLEYDNKAETFVVYYKEFPNAIATGATEEDAENNLAFLVEDMWRRRPTELKEFILHKHSHQIQIQTNRCVNT